MPNILPLEETYGFGIIVLEKCGSASIHLLHFEPGIKGRHSMSH